MTRALIVVALLLGCQSAKPPSGFGVNLTISVRDLPPETRARISQLRIVVAAENYDRTIDVKQAIASGEVRARYRPLVSEGALVFVIEALGDGVTLARVVSPEVPLTAGRAIDVPLTLEMAEATVEDMARADLGHADLSRAVDLGPRCEDTCTAQCMACNAQGQCAPAVGKVCKPSYCRADNNFVGDATCDANANCVEPAPVSNNCLSKKTNGADCGDGVECQTGKCVDGVCCESDCASLCMSCNLASRPSDKGKCVYVPAGEMPPRGSCPAKTGLDATCTPGGCDGNAAKCVQATALTPCKAASCDAPTRMQASTAYCAPDGTCAVPAATSCGGNYCSGTACATGCSADGDCVSGYFCDGVRCQPKKDQGADCTAFGDKECKNNICADGVCCNRDCDGACERCNGTVKGTCAFVTSNLAFHGSCTGQASPSTTCGGRCNGMQSDCFYPTVQCQAPSCFCRFGAIGLEEGCFFKAAVNCAAGSCATTTDARCPNQLMCEDATKCRTYCRSLSDCYGATSCQQALVATNSYCGCGGQTRCQ